MKSREEIEKRYKELKNCYDFILNKKNKAICDKKLQIELEFVLKEYIWILSD